MSDAIRDAIAAAIRERDGNDVMIGAYILAAEVIDTDGDTSLHELKSDSLPFWSAYGMARSLAATYEPQPGWSHDDD